jgi:hypothetical protein
VGSGVTVESLEHPGVTEEERRLRVVLLQLAKLRHRLERAVERRPEIVGMSFAMASASA